MGGGSSIGKSCEGGHCGVEGSVRCLSPAEVGLV